MDTDIKNMLDKLEPEINKKCIEIKQYKKDKLKQKLFVIVSIMLLIIPSVLVFLGVNIFNFIITIAIIISLEVFAVLPFIIKVEGENICYE